MPELPEVETIRRGLDKYLVGHTVESVDIRLPKIFQGDPKDVEGAKVTAVRRFGKGLVIDLSSGYSLAIHIKLTGQIVYRDKARAIRQQAIEVPNKFTHVIFQLDKGASLFYNDLRQFGWIKVVKTGEVGELPFFKELGPEFPINNQQDTTNKLTPHKFGSLVSKSNLAIKPLIMDQKKMAGLGNIYANDALYLAKINPQRPAKSLTSQEIEDLYTSIEHVLKEGLKYGGSSELTYVNALGEEGHYQDHTLIYGKDGQECSRDGTTIKKIMLAGRGTYFCPTCQK